MTRSGKGLPAGSPVRTEYINRLLALRQGGYGRGGRMKIERDHARITAGVIAGRTTGWYFSALKM